MRIAASLVLALGLLAGCHDGSPGATGASPSTPPVAAAAEKVLAPGDAFPAFRVDRVDIAGSIGLPNGKVTIITFIATWNEPAKKSLPKLEEIYRKHRAQGLEIIAISVDDTADLVPEFGKTYGATYPFTWDTGRVVASKVRPSSMPSTYVVDRKGIIRLVHRGYHDGSEIEIGEAAASLL